MKVLEFTSGEECRAHYIKIRKQIMRQLTPVKPEPKPAWFGGMSGSLTAYFIKPFVISQEQPSHITVNAIMDACCKRFNVTRMDLISARRTNFIVHARHIALYLAKQLTPLSYVRIAQRFGGRDHTTAMHAWRKIDRLCKTNLDVRQDVNDVCELLGAANETA